MSGGGWLVAGNWLPLIAGIGAFLLVAATVWAQFRVGRHASLISGYKETAEMAGARAEEHKNQAERLREQLNEAQSQIRALTARMAVLQDLVTGTSELESATAELKNAVDGAHVQLDVVVHRLAGQIMGGLQDLAAAMAATQVQLRQLRDDLSGQREPGVTAGE